MSYQLLNQSKAVYLLETGRFVLPFYDLLENRAQQKKARCM